jgi:hypothetical protein
MMHFLLAGVAWSVLDPAGRPESIEHGGMGLNLRPWDGNPKLCMIIDYEPSRQEMSGTCFRRFGVSKSWPINLLCPHEPCTLPGVSPTAVAPDLSCCSTTVCVALSRSKNVQQPQWHPKTSYQAQPQVFLQRVGAIHFIVNQSGSSFQDEKV